MIEQRLHDGVVSPTMISMRPCVTCGEAIMWHILIGTAQPVDTSDWHRITEGFLKPSDVFPHVANMNIPAQRTSSPVIESA